MSSAIARPTDQLPNRPAAAAPEVLTRVAAEIDRDLQLRLAAATLPPNLKSAVEYAVLGGGKRLRPALVMLCCEAVGGQRGEVMPAAAALELIHSFSLVHDDLPAMDDDDLRRGRPTLHVHAGEAMAILAGDVMVSLAFDFIAGSDLEAACRIALARELSQATTAMIAGQVYDTLGGFERKSIDVADGADGCFNSAPSADSMLERLHLIHRNKTGALIRAACRMGAIGAGATPAQLAAITSYGEAMGLMFQIVDDLLDVTQSAEHAGKATGKDESAGKLTFPGLLGIEGSRREVARLRETALEAISSLHQAAQPLRQLCESMAVRTK